MELRDLFAHTENDSPARRRSLNRTLSKTSGFLQGQYYKPTTEELACYRIILSKWATNCMLSFEVKEGYGRTLTGAGVRFFTGKTVEMDLQTLQEQLQKHDLPEFDVKFDDRRRKS